VKVWNRGDCCKERLSNYEIRIGDNPDVQKNPSCAGRYSGEQNITCMIRGRYVGVVIPGQAATLTICEIEAHELVVQPKTLSRENLLKGTTA